MTRKQMREKVLRSVLSVVVAAGVSWPAAAAWAAPDAASPEEAADAPAATAGASVGRAMQVLTVSSTEEVDIPYDISWYLDDPDSDEYALSTGDELRGLARLVNGTAENDGAPIAAVDFDSKTIRLADDIDLALYDYEQDRMVACEFAPIGTEEHPFAGTFDGTAYAQDGGFAGKHTVRNLYITRGVEIS